MRVTVKLVDPFRNPLPLIAQPSGSLPVQAFRNAVNSDEACEQLSFPDTAITYGPAGSDNLPTWSLWST